MSKAYHGKNTFASIKPEHEKEVLLLVETAPEHINFILKIVETHCHTSIPVQLDPIRGLLGFHTTADRAGELYEILKNIPRPLEIL